MWKRRNNPKDTRQHYGPRQDENSYSGYDENTSSGSHGLGIQVHRPAPPPQRDDMRSRGLPSLPFELPSPPPPEQQDSKLRPVSSIYSQPSPAALPATFPKNSYRSPTTPAYNTEEVSPPSSPEFNARQRTQNQPSDEEVSPIDEMPNLSGLSMHPPDSSASKPGGSNIPVLRREKRRNQVAEAAANLVTRKQVGGGGRPAKNPSWDPYSGEPTTAERGKKQTTKPGEFTPPSLRNAHAPSGQYLGNQPSVSAAARKPISFGDRVRKLAQNPPPAEKPQWRGASGRVSLVNTPTDNLDVEPLNIPRKDPQHVVQPSSPKAHVSPPSIVIGTHPASATTQRTTGTSQVNNSPATSPIFDSEIADRAGRNQSGGNCTTEIHQEQEVINMEERKSWDNHKSEPAPEPYVQPPSRFSISTFAPSEARSTPRPSTDTFEPVQEPRPPMPSPVPSYVSSSATSVLNRVRPKVGPTPRGAITRKAVNTASPVFISMNKRNSKNPGKSLPSTPAEIESQDLVTSLQAQLDDLQHRRNNITRSIRQMTELMPADNIIQTTEVRRKREIEKKKVEGLREEEQDVRQQEHDIGLRLHRAWKRKDKGALYEPTGLWVRRCTG